ncbi:hypothetical protein CBG25_18970 [Arsenophonus sp. ENCA]|nr:hypothetical protein CBG25_18970 [Arsenophonus sp. ENCA]
MDNHHAKNLERCVFFISDGTAITAETLGHAVLSQFPLNFSSYTLPFVTSEKRAEEIKQKIDQIYSKSATGSRLTYCFEKGMDKTSHPIDCNLP